MLAQILVAFGILSGCFGQMTIPSFPDVEGGSGQGVGGFKCRLPVDPGPCMAMIPRYRYDYTTQSCKRFMYGGCQGNGNNFETKEQCESECKPRHGQTGGGGGGDGGDDAMACQQPKDEGPCKGYEPRYYFNGFQCKRFIYGGCQGNRNNFGSKELCEKRCMRGGSGSGSGEQEPPYNPMACQQPKDEGPCRGSVLRFYFDGNRCRRFIYGGCQGNENNFKSKKICQRTCQAGGPLGRPYE
ncbi:hypothetical protein ACOME3_001179 [Neoechinorhynchus agilis]